MTAREIVKETDLYSEILILEQGTDKTDIDEQVPKLEKMAVYCVDQIDEEDVLRAKNEGLGIFLAYSKKKEIRPTQIKQ